MVRNAGSVAVSAEEAGAITKEAVHFCHPWIDRGLQTNIQSELSLAPVFHVSVLLHCSSVRNSGPRVDWSNLLQ